METQQINADDLPVYSGAQLPADAVLVILVEEPNYGPDGGTINLAYQLPLERIVPTNAIQKLSYSLYAPDAGISVPALTVVPAYIESFEPFALKRASATSNTTKAQFLIVATDPNVDDGYIIQSNGYFKFPTAHGYSIGQKYYLSDTVIGGVTVTAPSSVVQPLFVVLDATTIQINIGA